MQRVIKGDVTWWSAWYSSLRTGSWIKENWADGKNGVGEYVKIKNTANCYSLNNFKKAGTQQMNKIKSCFLYELLADNADVNISCSWDDSRSALS